MKTKTAVKKVGKAKKAFPMKKAPMQTPPQMAPQGVGGPPMMKKGGSMKKKGKC